MEVEAVVNDAAALAIVECSVVSIGASGCGLKDEWAFGVPVGMLSSEEVSVMVF